MAKLCDKVKNSVYIRNSEAVCEILSRFSSSFINNNYISTHCSHNFYQISGEFSQYVIYKVVKYSDLSLGKTSEHLTCFISFGHLVADFFMSHDLILVASAVGQIDSFKT